MLTNNTEITENDIGFVIHKMVKCGCAYVINIATIGEPFASALGTYDPRIKGKKFLLFTCCEAQEQNAKENIKNVVDICNEMVKNEDPVFIANALNESDSKESFAPDIKRILH